MMVGLDGSSHQKDIETAKKIIEIAPSQVRIYPTIVVDGTELAKRYEKGEYTPISLNEAVKTTAELMTMFENANINIIKVGLHSDESLMDGAIAGPLHPAFRELCESLIFYNKIENQLQGKEKGNYIVKVNTKDVSKVIGQKKENTLKFKQLGYNLKIHQLDVKQGTIEVGKEI